MKKEEDEEANKLKKYIIKAETIELFGTDDNITNTMFL